MADLRGYYDPNAKMPTGFEVLPAGVYTVKIIHTDWKDTKNHDGKYLEVRMEVAAGEHAGSVVYDRLNLQNQSQTAVAIAKGQLLAICEAIGIRDPKDSKDLENIRFQVVLKCEKRNDDPTKWTNRVQRYCKLGEASEPAQAAEPPPWSRNAPKTPERRAEPEYAEYAAANDDGRDELPF